VRTIIEGCHLQVRDTLRTKDESHGRGALQGLRLFLPGSGLFRAGN
jgi:hypothetical protein